MNIIEAFQSGPRVKRKNKVFGDGKNEYGTVESSGRHGLVFVVNHIEYALSIEDLRADDWEAEMTDSEKIKMLRARIKGVSNYGYGPFIHCSDILDIIG